LPCAAIARPIVDNCDITGFANNGIEINSAGAFVAINNTRIENVSGVGILVVSGSPASVKVNNVHIYTAKYGFAGNTPWAIQMGFPHWYAKATFFPSNHLKSRSASDSAETRRRAPGSSGPGAHKKPINGIRLGCCAFAASGQAAVEAAITLMKSRRRIGWPAGKDHCNRAFNFDIRP
jgi:hypothetical protein